MEENVSHCFVGMHIQNSEPWHAIYLIESTNCVLRSEILQLGDVILKTAARLNLPINWIPGRLSEQNFDLEEPPTKSSPWVGVLLNHLRVFHQRLETLGAINQHDINQVQDSCQIVLARRSPTALHAGTGGLPLLL